MIYVWKVAAVLRMGFDGFRGLESCCGFKDFGFLEFDDFENNRILMTIFGNKNCG